MRRDRNDHQPSRRLVMRTAVLGMAAAAVSGCVPARRSGPVEIKWDRDVCAHCSMAISDRRFAAQVRGGPRREVWKFDDIGCAILWLQGRPWHSEPGTEIWVTAYDNGRWLDARSATYLAGKTSPMGYNFGAAPPATPGAIGFEHLRPTIFELDRKARSRPAIGEAR